MYVCMPFVTIELLTNPAERTGEEKRALGGAFIVERSSIGIGGGEAIGEKV